MSKPPEDISPEELVLKLSEARPSFVVPLPRRGKNGDWICKVRICVLSQQDHTNAQIAAHAQLKKQAARWGLEKLDPVDMTSRAITEALGDMIAHELLCRACHFEKPNPGSSEENPTYPLFFRDADHIRQVLAPNEIVVLYGAYLLVQERFGPFESNVRTKEDVDAWIARLQAGMDDPLDLARLPLPRLAEVTSSLARRLFSISQVLRSQWWNLPNGLGSDLAPFCLDTSYFGEQPAGSTADGSGRSEGDALLPQDRLVTMDEAMELAEKIIPK